MLSVVAPTDRPARHWPPLKRSDGRGLHHKHRPTFWYDRDRSRLLSETGEAVTLPKLPSLADVLNAIAATDSSPTDHYTLWILGGDRAANTPDRAWFTAPVSRHWELSRYQGGAAEDASARAAQYRAAHCTIDVRLTAAWFADVADLDTARRGYLRTWAVLRSAFGPQTMILPTPAMTGLELLQQNLPFGREYPRVPDDLMRMLWAMPQGRFELFTDQAEGHINAERRVLPGVYNLDGVFMYAACVKELPVGRLVADTVPIVYEHAPGFYEIAAQVPADWRHVGLLPHYKPDGTRCYPWRRGQYCTASGWFATFVTGAELQLATKHGWRVNIHRRYVWPDKAGDPLRTWSERIKTVREAWSIVPDPLAPLVRDGLRHVLLDPIGAFARHETFEEAFAAYGQEDSIPVDAYQIHREEHGVSYRVPVEPTAYHARWMHPEWSAMVWGRVRSRGAYEMLRHPVDELVAYRADGVWLAYNPGYPASTHAGDWRLKHALEKPVAAPANTAAMLRLIRRARATGGD